MSNLRLNEILKAFVDSHSGMDQRGKAWYDIMPTTIGGSELAALMGINPYCSIVDVISSKMNALKGINSFNGGPACHWGTLFEDVICEFISTDLGNPVLGDSICIQAYAGHRNSPDGYIVAQLYKDDEGKLHLWTTDMDPEISTFFIILLLEFKCPISRKPKSKIPAQYVPQVKSGLAVSPIANKGMFVDAIFRKCSFTDLSCSPEYDKIYHQYDRDHWDLPLAWGMIGVYAPSKTSSDQTKYGWKEEKWIEGDYDIKDKDSNGYIASLDIAKYTKKINDTTIIDLGITDKSLFDRTLKLIDKKIFKVVRMPSCFEDGRGIDLHTSDSINDYVEHMDNSAPDNSAPGNYYLCGILSWKLLQVDYHFVNRQQGFMEDILPIITEVHQTARDANASPDPSQYLHDIAIHKKWIDPSDHVTFNVESIFM